MGAAGISPLNAGYSLTLDGACTRPFPQAASNSLFSTIPSLLISTCAKSSTCAKLTMSEAAPACAGVLPFVTAWPQAPLHWSGVRTAGGRLDAIVFWAEANPAVSSNAALVKATNFVIEPLPPFANDSASATRLLG